MPGDHDATALLSGPAAAARQLSLKQAVALALLPLALGLGGTSETWGPMATSLVWGLAFASVLTLFVIPARIAILDDFKSRFLGGHGA